MWTTTTAWRWRSSIRTRTGRTRCWCSSDTGGLITLTAYDKDLNQLWQHAEHRAKDYFGHYIYPYDVNGDGIDEVTISHLCLDAEGHEVWNDAKYFEDNHDHMDAMEFFDMNGDGKPELVVGQSDAGTMEYNAQTGAILWQNQSDHTQQITAGYILANSPTPQAVANGRTYGAPVPRPAGFQPGARPAGAAAGAGAGPQPGFGRQQGPADQIAISGGLAAQLYWFDNRGRLLERWPAHPLNGNPNFVRGDWYGTGKRTYFWFRFKLEPDGNGDAVLQGRGLPHVRLRPHRSRPGDHAGGRGRRSRRRRQPDAARLRQRQRRPAREEMRCRVPQTHRQPHALLKTG